MAAARITRSIVPPWALSPTAPRQTTSAATVACADRRLAASDAVFVTGGRQPLPAQLLEKRVPGAASSHAGVAPGFAAPGGTRGRNVAMVVAAATFPKKVKVGAGRLAWKPKRAGGEEQQGGKSVEQRRWEVLMTELLAAGKRRKLGMAADGATVAEIMGNARAAGWLQRTDVVGAVVRLNQLRVWNVVVEVFDWLQAPDQRAEGWWRMTQRDYAMLITAAARCHRLSRAEQALRDLVNDSAEEERAEGGRAEAEEREGARKLRRMEPNTVVMTGMVEAYARCGQLEQAEAVVRRMESKGPAPSALTYQCLLKGYSAAGRLEDVERVFEELLERSGQGQVEAQAEEEEEEGDGEATEAGETTATAAGKTGDAAAAPAPLAAAAAVSMSPTAAAAGGASAEAAVQVDERMFNVLIDCYARARRVEDASRMYRRMKAIDVPPSRTTFNTLIAMFAREARSREAEAVLKQMQAAGIRPDVMTYTALMSAYGRAARAEEAQAVFRDMIMCRIRPTAVSYTALMDAYGRAGDVDNAEFLFKEMKRNRYLPSESTFNALLSAHCRAGSMDRAEQLLRQMWWDAQDRGEAPAPTPTPAPPPPPTPSPGNKYGREGGLLPVSALPGVGVGAEAAPAAAVAAEEEEGGAGSRGAAKHGSWGVEFGDGGRVSPSASTFNIVMNGYRRAGDLDKVVFTFERMLEAGIDPTVVSYSVLISAHGDSGDFDGAVAAFREMVGEAGMVPDKGVRTALLHACKVVGEGEEGEEGGGEEEEGGLVSARKEEVRLLLEPYFGGDSWGGEVEEDGEWIG